MGTLEVDISDEAALAEQPTDSDAGVHDSLAEEDVTVQAGR